VKKRRRKLGALGGAVMQLTGWTWEDGPIYATRRNAMRVDALMSAHALLGLRPPKELVREWVFGQSELLPSPAIPQVVYEGEVFDTRRPVMLMPGKRPA